MSWHKPYNISGTIHVADRLNELHEVLQHVFPGEIGLMGTFIGDTLLVGGSEDASIMSSGKPIRDFFILVAGERRHWISFANRLEESLTFADFPYTLVVHDNIVNG